MDAIEFLKGVSRMCSKEHCYSCGLSDKSVCQYNFCGWIHLDIDFQQFVTDVENWCNEHPEKTNAQKFEEVFGFDPSPGIIKTHNLHDKAFWDEPYKGVEG